MLVSMLTPTMIAPCLTFAQGAPINISPATQTKSPGDTVIIDVMVDATGCTLKGCEVTVEYADNVMIPGTIMGHNLIGGLEIGPTQVGNTINYAMAHLGGGTADVNGSVLTIEFTIDGAAPADTYDFTLVEAELRDQDNSELQINIANGSATIVFAGGGGFAPVAPSAPTPTPTSTPSPLPVVSPTLTPTPIPSPPSSPTPSPVGTPTPVPTPEETEETAEELRYTLTIDTELSDGGFTDPPPGEYIYPEGTQVTITATAEEDWEFVGWSGDISSTDTTAIVAVDQDVIIIANFDEGGGSPTNWALISGTIIATIAVLGTVIFYYSNRKSQLQSHRRFR